MQESDHSGTCKHCCSVYILLSKPEAMVKGKEKSANNGLPSYKENSGFCVGNRMEMVEIGAFEPRRKLSLEHRKWWWPVQGK